MTTNDRDYMREYMRDYRAARGVATFHDRVQRRARVLAVKWVMDNHPEVWRDLYEQARQQRLAALEGSDG